MSRFRDHFSGHAEIYAHYRPSYPEELFSWLSNQCEYHQAAWDCGTGNGQAVLGLVARFDRVVASDASIQQLQYTPRRKGLNYLACQAEHSALATGSMDIVTVAQAYHWFDHQRFGAEVRRVLKPRGILAVWVYQGLQSHPQIEAIVEEYYSRTVGPYWPEERVHVETGYRDLPFPLPEIDTPDFILHQQWDLATLLGYLSSWSATRRYQAATGRDPVQEVGAALSEVWGNPADRVECRWPLTLRVGRNG